MLRSDRSRPGLNAAHWCAAATVLLGVFLSPGTRADGNALFDIGDLHVTWNAEAGIGIFAVPDANFGAGSYQDGRGGDTRRNTPFWGEAYVKPGVGFTRDLLGGKFYANFSTIYAQTVGDGDAELFTAGRGNPGEIDLEEANFGFTADLPGIEPGTWDLQIGRQNFVVDDGFLLAEGTLNGGPKADYYLVPRNVFDGVGVLHLNGTPIRGDIFYLRDDTQPGLTRRGYDQFPTTFAGFDVTWFENAATDGADGSKTYGDRKRYATLTYFHVTSSVADGEPTPRDGMNVYSLAAGGTLLPSLPNFTFYAQGVLERNDNPGRHVSADAWYVEPGWTFSNLPLTPNIFYRYSHFSGGRDPNNPAGGTYDPLFYGTGYRGGNFGSWYYGEIVSDYFIANADTNIHQVMLTLNLPFHVLNDQDSLNLHVIYYHYLLDQPISLGASSSSLADELNIATEYQYNPQTTISAAIGFAVPGAGAKQIVAGQLGQPPSAAGRFDHMTETVELYATTSF